MTECMPGLHGAEAVNVADASGVDSCCMYDLVADDDFILGPVPGADNVFTGVGWRGTGYKFAPWVGRVLAQLALQQGTVFDIRRFARPVRWRPCGERTRGRRCGFMNGRSPKGIVERLASGTVLGAEGYVFELERRGYIKAGPYVPEVVLDFPDAVRQLHREFLSRGSEVMVALTCYAHREKLRHVGREGDLEAINRCAVRIAREVAQEGDALVRRQRLQHVGLRPG